jgi:hypothetical protein
VALVSLFHAMRHALSLLSFLIAVCTSSTAPWSRKPRSRGWRIPRSKSVRRRSSLTSAASTACQTTLRTRYWKLAVCSGLIALFAQSIAGKWDKKKTLKQNYAALGLALDSNHAVSQAVKADSEDTEMVSLEDFEAMKAAAAGGLLVEKGAVKPHSEGKASSKKGSTEEKKKKPAKGLLEDGAFVICASGLGTHVVWQSSLRSRTCRSPLPMFPRCVPCPAFCRADPFILLSSSVDEPKGGEVVADFGQEARREL